MFTRRTIFVLVFILVLSYFSIRPLLLPGYFTMHDDQQVVRLFEMDKALLAGQFPVRWVEGLGFGYGYALFNFYPPLAYYIGEIFHLIGFGLIDSIKIVWALAIVGSGLTMYFLGKNLFGKAGGIVAAIFYIYAPYHAVDAYIRGALAELSSFVWLPLILLFAKKTAETGKVKYALWTSVFLALLMLTHNLIFLPFFGITAVWFLLMVLIYRQNLFRSGMNLAIFGALCFGLTAFFWLPSLWEKQFTLVDSLLIKNLALYEIHFLCPEQLWNSPWGFGGSGVGCADGVSFKIGKLHILGALASLIVIAKLWLSGNKKLSLVLSSCFLILLGCVFMTTEYSKFIWDNVSILWYLQFPWRFLEFITLFTSILAGSLVLISKKKFVGAAVAAILVGAVIFQNAKLFTPQTQFLDATDQSLTTTEKVKWDISGTSFEYMPKGVATKITDLGVLWVDITKPEIKTKNYKTTNISVTDSEFKPDSFRFNTRSQTDGQVEVQITNFPGWTVWLDGKPVEIVDNNKYKLITINIPAGTHEISGKFQNTPVRTIGNLISLVSLIGLFFLIVWSSKKQPIKP